MSSTNTADTVPDRQRQRAARKLRGGSAAGGSQNGRPVSPPKERRPALAALALLLIVGGALAAGLMAVRMDSRQSVLVAREDIAPGTRITRDLLATANVATDNVPTILAEQAPQVIGAYATTTIPANALVEERSLSSDQPVSADRAIVSVPLNPALTPSSELEPGDLVQVVRASGQNTGSGSGAQDLTTGLVLSISTQEGDDLGGQGTSSASLLVPSQVAAQVIDAAAGDLAGLALLERGQSTDVQLEVSR